MLMAAASCDSDATLIVVMDAVLAQHNVQMTLIEDQASSRGLHADSSHTSARGRICQGGHERRKNPPVHPTT